MKRQTNSRVLILQYVKEPDVEPLDKYHRCLECGNEWYGRMEWDECFMCGGNDLTSSEPKVKKTREP